MEGFTLVKKPKDNYKRAQLFAKEKVKVNNKEFVAEMKEKLLEMKSKILHTLNEENEDYKQLLDQQFPGDAADIASGDIDRKALEALSAAEIKRLRQIDAALSRINTGRYGYCLKCEKPIGTDRLRAIPYALYCIDEQRKMDTRR